MGRLWVRFGMIKKAWWDDFFLVAAVVSDPSVTPVGLPNQFKLTTSSSSSQLSFNMITITVCIDMNYGMGLHAWTVPLQNLTPILKCQYVFGIAYSLSTACIKMSLLFQYLRIYERGSWTHLTTRIVLVLVGLWGFAYTFMSIFNCFPSPAAFWDRTNVGCYGFASPDTDQLIRMIVGHAASNFTFDLIVLLLAVLLQFEEDAATTRRSLTLLLAVGSISCGFALWRLCLVTLDGPTSTLDPTFHQPPTFLLSIVEIYLAASCATTPFFWPIVRDGFTKIFVTYELNITSEARVHHGWANRTAQRDQQGGGGGMSAGGDGHHSAGGYTEVGDHIELAHRGTVPAGTGRGGEDISAPHYAPQRYPSSVSKSSFNGTYFTEDDYGSPISNSSRPSAHARGQAY
jgi:hypothetical protein